ncbi:640_t:CDS:1, partial [Scutellospora calospora]
NLKQDKKLSDEIESKSFLFEAEIYTIDKESQLEIEPLTIE